MMIKVTVHFVGIKVVHYSFINEAISSFNACQTYFRLNVVESNSEPPAKIHWPSFAKNFKHNDFPQIIITDVPFADNWFSHTDGKIAAISTSEWFCLLKVPLSLQCYLLMEMALACSLFMVEQSEENVPPHEKSVGCLYDMCGYKPDILLKLRAGYVCADHINRLLALGASQNAIDAIQCILNLSRAYALSRDEDKRRLGAIRSRKVFVVYGRDEYSLGQLQSLLETLGLQPVIIKNEPRYGAITILEMIERHFDVSYAFILFTPDDIGRLRMLNGIFKRVISLFGGNGRFRARQNVILECGMFIGLLGRRKIACIVKGEQLEMPSDLLGVLQFNYKYNIDEIKKDILRELDVAGYQL